MLRLSVALAAYFIAHVVLRISVSDSLELDEAEQTILGQWLLPGYSDQPPLYSWLQWLFFSVLGVNVFAISMLKNVLLFSAYACVFLTAKLVCGDIRRATLATLSLLLIPQIAWESQRDLTHTVIVFTVSAATLYLVLRLHAARSALGYLALGVALGAGLLSKFNYAPFAIAVIFALMSTRGGRGIVCDRRMAISIMACLLVVSPYGIWFANHAGEATAKLSELETGQATGIAQGFGKMLLAAGVFLSPLWLICLLLFPSGFAPRRRIEHTPGAGFLRRYLMSIGLLLAAGLLLFGVSNFHTRWMQPLLFPLPIYFFAGLNLTSLDSRAVQRFVVLAACAGGLVLLGLGFKVVGAGVLADCGDLNFPSAAIANELRDAGLEPRIIVAHPHTIAGNMRLQFPKASIYSPRYRTIRPVNDTAHMPIIAVWETTQGPSVPTAIRDYLGKSLAPAITSARTMGAVANCRYARKQAVSVGYACIGPVARPEQAPSSGSCPPAKLGSRSDRDDAVRALLSVLPFLLDSPPTPAPAQK